MITIIVDSNQINALLAVQFDLFELLALCQEETATH